MMSNPLYTNFKKIHDDLQLMASKHKQINSFGLGDTDQLSYWTQIRDGQPNPTFESPVFPLLYIVPGVCTNNLQFKNWEFNMVMMDIVDRDLTNQVDVLSDTLQMMQDVLSQYRLSIAPQFGCYDTYYDLLQSTTITPFMEKYSDLTNGWTAQLQISTTTPLDRCAAAYNVFTGSPIIHDSINFKTFHDDFRLLADHHKQINSFGFGSFEDLSYWTESRLKQENTTFESPYFPLLYVVPSNAISSSDQNGSSYMIYEFNVVVLDIIDRDLTNQVDVLSDTNQILDDIVGQFRLSVDQSLGCFNAKYYLDEAVQYTPFLEKYSDLCGGWSGLLRIQVMTPLDRCDAAFESFLGPTPTPSITPTITPTPSSTPAPICPELFVVSNSTAPQFDNGTYIRQHIASGITFDYAYVQNNQVILGTAPDGNNYPIYQFFDGGDFNTTYALFIAGSFIQWNSIEQGQSILSSGATFIGSIHPINTNFVQIGNVRYLPSGAQGITNGPPIITYPSICPTPSSTPTNTPTPSQP